MSCGMPARMKILTTILLALAVVLGGCAYPVDESEAAAEAEGALYVRNDPTEIKNAITNGATYNASDACLVVSGQNRYPVLTDNVWSLSATPGRRLNAVVFDRIAVGTILSNTPDGEYDNVVHVPEGAYLPNQGETTENEAWHTIDPGTVGGVAHVVLGAP